MINSLDKKRALTLIELLVVRKRAFTLIELLVVRKPAFTLIELLIASTIFAMIMVIVVGTFSWAAGYNNKLKETRKVAQNGRMIMSEISTEVRLANGSISYHTVIANPPAVIGEVILLTCGTSLESCALVANSSSIRYKGSLYDAITEFNPALSNAILILKKDQNKAILYRTILSGTNYNFTKQEIEIDWDATLTLSSQFSSGSTLNDSSVSTRVYFGGYGPTGTDLSALNTNKKQQPFVEFYLIGKSADYNNLRSNNRSKFEAKTLVETRYYN